MKFKIGTEDCSKLQLLLVSWQSITQYLYIQFTPLYTIIDTIFSITEPFHQTPINAIVSFYFTGPMRSDSVKYRGLLLLRCMRSHVTTSWVSLWPSRIVNDSVYRDPRCAREDLCAYELRHKTSRAVPHFPPSFGIGPKIFRPWYNLVTNTYPVDVRSWLDYRWFINNELSKSVPCFSVFLFKEDNDRVWAPARISLFTRLFACVGQRRVPTCKSLLF